MCKTVSTLELLISSSSVLSPTLSLSSALSSTSAAHALMQLDADFKYLKLMSSVYLAHLIF